MPDRSEADDFFGIEYMMSQTPKVGNKEEQVETIKDDSKPKKSFRIRSDVSDMGKDVSQLSGTEFLDRAFFPQLELDPEASEKNHNEQSKNFIEEQFFRRIDSADVAEVSTTSESEQSIELDHHVEKPRPKHAKFSQRRRVSPTPQEGDPRRVEVEQDSFERSSDESPGESGLNKIRADIIPVWRMNENELVELMIDRVLYKDDDIVALDKPYGMAYSGASQNAPQLDRLLQKIKAEIVPKCERLYLVRSLDKFQSGIVLFATFISNKPSFHSSNASMQSAMKKNFEGGMVEQISRCIVRGELEDSPLKITIPLIKTVKNRDMKLVPLVTNKAKGEIFYVHSECRTIKGNQYVSSVEVRTHREIPHQIRAHLALAGCPLIGDSKYSNSSPRPPRLSHHVLGSLNVTDSQSRKIPMYLHLREVRNFNTGFGLIFFFFYLVDCLGQL
ncbi:unnamed protein product [Haemonchus placei]|uniref:Pseudouridylate synthase RPUSD4, mitochondrial n=1 Tax=Haemonchus placei TaxID=6290 RepID=A0A0N4X319_HAEPC|nr:unnamed protein product [Haemonchus placei]